MSQCIIRGILYTWHGKNHNMERSAMSATQPMIQSKWAKTCAICKTAYAAGATVYGIPTGEVKPDGSAKLRWCTNPACQPGTGAQTQVAQQYTPPPTQPQQQAAQSAIQTGNVAGIPDAPEPHRTHIQAAALEIMQVRKHVLQTVMQFEASPNPAMVGQMVGLIWQHCKYHRKPKDAPTEVPTQ